MRMRRLGFGFGAVALVAITAVSSANEKHFKNANDGRSCGSLITRDLMNECNAIQAKKNEVCNRKTSCEPDKQAEWAKEYDDLYRWWDNEGKNAPDNQYKSDRKRKMSELDSYMKAQQAAALAGIPISQECITARNAVQKFYEDRAIPLAHEVKTDLLSQRRALVDKHNENQSKREEAKKKYEADPKDDNLKRAWEAARDAAIKAGQDVDEFDRKYGPDIQYWADRLVNYYRTEKSNHDDVSQKAEVRLAKCQTSSQVTWKSLPF